MKPHALVTNDDGIDSAFLHQLVAALLPDFQVSVAAPASEQSWIGRAMTRREEVEVIHRPTAFAGTSEAWSISGTPSDCVNIALGHLLPQLPQLVVSGINIGYNTTESLILCSGTVAGAIEGALWGLPALACSMCVPHELFSAVSRSQGQTSGDFAASLQQAARRAAQLCRATLDAPPATGTVVNINFPARTCATTRIVETCPAKIEQGNLFEQVRPGKFRFCYHPGQEIQAGPETDRGALLAGHISRSLLDFSKVGARE